MRCQCATLAGGTFSKRHAAKKYTFRSTHETIRQTLPALPLGSRLILSVLRVECRRADPPVAPKLTGDIPGDCFNAEPGRALDGRVGVFVGVFVGIFVGDGLFTAYAFRTI